MIEKLKKQLRQILHPNLIDYMFSGQLKKQLESIRILNESIKSGIELTQMMEILDLIFKWITIILYDQSNTAIIKSTMEYIKLMFDKLFETKYSLTESESNIIFPILCEKLGIQNSNIKETVQQILTTSLKLYSPKNIFIYLMRALDSKHSHTKAECLCKIKSMISEFGLKIISPREIKAFGKLLCHGGDSTVKTEVIEVIVEIYKYKGASIWTLLKEVPEKVREYLKARFNGVTVVKEGEIVPQVRPATAAPTQAISVSPSNPQVLQMSAASQEEIKGQPTPPRPPPPALTFSPNFSDEKPRHSSTTVKMESIAQALDILLTPDPAKRVDALIFISEQASNPDAAPLTNDVDKMLAVFAKVLQDIFAGSSPLQNGIRFAKYFMTIMNRICTIKSIVKNASKESMSALMEQLLIDLQYPGLAKLGDKGEGEALMKLLNMTMLRLLENCNPTRAFCSLINLFHKHKHVSSDDANGKLPGLIVKCVLKLTKVIDSLLPALDISEVLLLLHEHMPIHPAIPTLDPAKKNENEEIGQRIAKTIINELVKLKREAIWEYYAPIQNHARPDVQIKRWINIILNTLSTFGYSNNPVLGSQSENNIQPLSDRRDNTGANGSTVLTGRLSTETEQAIMQSEASVTTLKGIIEGLYKETTFGESIEKLRQYKATHQELDLTRYFQGCSKEFASKVMSLIGGEAASSTGNQGILGKAI